MKIWLRLAISILLSVAVCGAGLIYWATREQRTIAEDQARYFADSVHQMTLAGLTGMMITGTISLRIIFLDQIKAMNHVESLRVLRSEAVVGQFGPGFEMETATDETEREVMRTGEASYVVVPGQGGDRLRAVIPARAQEDYLGKNCLNCHHVAAGTVLGAVSMEISLSRAEETVRAFGRNAAVAGLAACVPLGIFIWYFISRLVSRPLRRMTDGLERIAQGDVDEPALLPCRGNDEVAIAAAAFNRVMTKARDLIQQQRLAQRVFESALEGITVTDAQSRIQMVNRAFTDTTGYEAHEVVGKTPAVLKSGRQDETFYAGFWQALREKGEWRGEIWNRRKDGTVYPEWLNVNTVRNGRGEVEHYVAMFSDITERKHWEERITFQAFHDALTGLPNRLLFRDRLEQAINQARRHWQRTPAVMFLDLDRFKQINDTFGHEAGDRLLQAVAARLRGCVRATDTVARLAGDEFAILLPEIVSEDAAREVGEKILDAMREPVCLGVESRVVTTSIGVAMFPRDGQDPQALLKSADVAMYAVKGQTRAGMGFFAKQPAHETNDRDQRGER
jgi:diguanylate cyclase (GGDEF)-like protein/PAS domain S-box-containing protein